MKTANRSLRLLAYGLCLATALYNCKTKNVDSLTPFTYTFKGLEPVTLPTVTPTAPAAVSTTAAAVVSSTVTAAVSSGLASLSATGQVPAAVQQAATDMGKAVAPAKAASLVAAFTPAVLADLTTTGTLPASLKADMAAIASNPALQAYWPSFTLPKVNGKAIGGREGVLVVVTPVTMTNATADDDACKAAANAAYNTALKGLDDAKSTQTNTINTTYTQIAASIAAATTACKSGKPATYDAFKATAKLQYDQAQANLASGKTVLGETTYTLLSLLYIVAYSDALSDLATLLAADTNACDAIATASLANAKTAQTTDINKINANYNAAAATLSSSLAKAIASCHNQGNGG